MRYILRLTRAHTFTFAGMTSFPSLACACAVAIYLNNKSQQQ